MKQFEDYFQKERSKEWNPSKMRATETGVPIRPCRLSNQSTVADTRSASFYPQSRLAHLNR